MEEVTHDHLPLQRFNTLYSTYQTTVERTIGRVLLAGPDRELIEDTAQEVWLKIWRAIAATPEMVIVPAWVMTVATNTARDALRRKYGSHGITGSRPVPSSLDASVPIIVDERELASDPEAIALHQETIAELYADIPAEYHPHIQLRVQGFHLREIEQVLQCSHNTVRTALDRRRKRKEANHAI